MAKFQGGVLVGEIRNSLGDQTFARNAHGAYTRYRVTPDTTATIRRDLTQLIWAEVAGRWNLNVTDSQRNAWHAWAQLCCDSKSPIGPKALNGRNAFTRINQRLGLYGATYLDEPPWEQGVQQLESLSANSDADAQSLTLSFSPSPLPSNHPMMIMATPNLNPGRMFAADQMLFLQYLDPGATSPQRIDPAWLARLWPTIVPHTPALQTIEAGKKIFIRARLLNTANGAYSVNQLAVATTTGTGVGMFKVTTTLTDAQIKALPSVPVLILAGIPGQIIVPIMTTLQVQCSAGAYTNITSAASATISLAITTGVSILIRNDLLLTPAGKHTVLLPPAAYLDATPPTIVFLRNLAQADATFAGQPLNIACGNAAGNFTGGNAANSLKATVWYQLIDAI